MIRFTLIFIGIVLVSNTVYANENIPIEQIYNMAQNVFTATEKWQQDIKEYSLEGRKSKFFPFGLLPFHALWGFGGLNALAVLFAVKFKLIIIASIIAFSVYYYTKFIALKKCNNSFYRETVTPPESTYSGSTFYSRPIVAYSSPIASDSHSVLPLNYYDINDHSDTKTYTFNQEPYDHQDLDHLHSYDFEHSSTDHSSPYYAASEGNDTRDSGRRSPPMMSAMYLKNRRKRARELQNGIVDIGELAFRFLGVNSYECRRRFVCELDFRAQTNPITRLAFIFIGKNFFEQYRYLDETNSRPQTFSDCARVFDDCKDAEKYNEQINENVQHS